MTNDVVLLPFEKSHLAGALQLSQEMAWPYRLQDWDAALRMGNGFVLQGAGTVIGTALWWGYGERHASAGMVIVAKSAQGRGHGARLVDALLAAADSRAIALNSTAEGMALYQRRGFVRLGVVHQHQGTPAVRSSPPSHSLVRPMFPTDLEAIAQLDQEASGWERQPMLRQLVQTGDGHVLVRNGTLRGYAISRAFGRGQVIGPVVAESAPDARALIEAALARLGPVFVRVDTAADSGLGPWLADMGLPQVDRATTMVRGTPAAPTGPARMFALANQSFN